MAVTKVDIASRALIMMGAQPISSFSDDSTEALVVNNIYEEIVESSLTRHRWRFATGQKQLSLLADAPVGRYTYAYQMPTNPLVLKISAVTVNDYSIPYDRYEDKIYVNDYGSQSTVIMDYIFRQDESQFQLASVFAGSIARDSGMIREFGDRAERQYLIAKNTDSQETTTNKLDTHRYLNLRQSTRSAV